MVEVISDSRSRSVTSVDSAKFFNLSSASLRTSSIRRQRNPKRVRTLIASCDVNEP